MTIIMRDLKKIIEHLAELKPAQPNLDSDLPVTIKEGVELLSSKLRHMMAQGFTLTELATALNEHGLPVKANTLSRYLAENQDDPLKKATKNRRTYKTKASTKAVSTEEMCLGSSKPVQSHDSSVMPAESGQESMVAHPLYD